MKMNPHPTSYQLMVGFQWGWHSGWMAQLGSHCPPYWVPGTVFGQCCPHAACGIVGWGPGRGCPLKGLAGEAPCDEMPENGERGRFLGKTIPGQRNSECKGPEAGAYLVCWNKSKKPGLDWSGKRGGRRRVGERSLGPCYFEWNGEPWKWFGVGVKGSDLNRAIWELCVEPMQGQGQSRGSG